MDKTLQKVIKRDLEKLRRMRELKKKLLTK
jgi:hypothetical protein